jgi:hypothetical protein
VDAKRTTLIGTPKDCKSGHTAGGGSERFGKGQARSEYPEEGDMRLWVRMRLSVLPESIRATRRVRHEKAQVEELTESVLPSQLKLFVSNNEGLAMEFWRTYPAMVRR